MFDILCSTSISYNEQSDSDDDGDSDGNNKRKKFRRGSLLIKFPWFKNNQNKEKDKEFYNALNDSDFLTDEDEELDNFESVCITVNYRLFKLLYQYLILLRLFYRVQKSNVVV